MIEKLSQTAIIKDYKNVLVVTSGVSENKPNKVMSYRLGAGLVAKSLMRITSPHFPVEKLTYSDVMSVYCILSAPEILTATNQSEYFDPQTPRAELKSLPSKDTGHYESLQQFRENIQQWRKLGRHTVQYFLSDVLNLPGINMTDNSLIAKELEKLKLEHVQNIHQQIPKKIY